MNAKVMVELVFYAGGCELRASVTDDKVVYAHDYSDGHLDRLAADILSLPEEPTQADFARWSDNETEELCYEFGICRDEDAERVELGDYEIWQLTDFLSYSEVSEVPDQHRKDAVLFSLLLMVAALDLKWAAGASELDEDEVLPTSVSESSLH